MGETEYLFATFGLIIVSVLSSFLLASVAINAIRSNQQYQNPC